MLAGAAGGDQVQPVADLALARDHLAIEALRQFALRDRARADNDESGADDAKQQSRFGHSPSLRSSSPKGKGCHADTPFVIKNFL